MRSIRERLERLACAEHCRFFKPWTEETGRCGAYEWLLRKASGTKEILDAMERLRGTKPILPLAFDSLLRRTVCSACGYYPANCRFRAQESRKDATPCGALIVLDLLLHREMLNSDEFYEPPTQGRAAPA